MNASRKLSTAGVTPLVVRRKRKVLRLKAARESPNPNSWSSVLAPRPAAPPSLLAFREAAADSLSISWEISPNKYTYTSSRLLSRARLNSAIHLSLEESAALLPDIWPITLFWGRLFHTERRSLATAVSTCSQLELLPPSRTYSVSAFFDCLNMLIMAPCSLPFPTLSVTSPPPPKSSKILRTGTTGPRPITVHSPVSASTMITSSSASFTKRASR
mmetsp:Transcript_27058/g.50589  ORF Transcript_27058/g.50589 Transcript_27058/m.50589 type:complete len:216 (+) Transcript_27058:2393-3040(+)